MRNEHGSALMMTVIILFIILGFGTALMATANGVKTAASNQQSGESAYSLAEAALNAQIYALSVKWPTANNGPGPATTTPYGYPTSCNAASNGASYCPSASDLGAYPSNSQTCPTGTPGDAWSPGATRSAWTTYVRDAPAGHQQFFDDTFENTAAAPPYNASYVPSGSNYVWVRAVGTVNCKTAVLVSEVSMQSLAITFPKLVLNADGFTITDSGNKTIINTQGVSSTTSQISVRCDGNTTLPPPCATIPKSTQISPTTSWQSPPAPTPTLNSTQLATLKSLAQANGTYYPASTNCNTIGAAQLQGSPVYIEGSSTCAISIGSNSTINSLTSPGFIVLVNGSLSFGGSSTYYGVIYGLNQSGSTASIVTLGGTSTVVGGLAVDGTATLSLGSSGNGVQCTTGNKCGDLEFDSAAFNTITGYGGADQTPNTFRQLPANQ